MLRRAGLLPLALGIGCLGIPTLASQSLAADPFPIAMPVDHGFFGEVSGSYILESPIEDWQFIGFEPQDYSRVGLGDGFKGNLKLGYRWGVWDAAIGLGAARLSDGEASVTQTPANLNTARLSADLFTVDAEIGYSTQIGTHSIRAAAGLRYADWSSEVNTFWPGNIPEVNGPIHHDFAGLGPIVRLSGSTPLGNVGSTLEYGVAGAVMFGRLETTSGNVAYVCSSCTSRSETAVMVSGEVGFGFEVAPTVRAVIGWQAEYWSGVNVEVTDLDFSGRDAGTSDYLLTGPFLKVKF